MTRKAFVIGHPVAHSRSPLIHNHWLHGLNIAGSYEPIDVAPDELAGFADRLRTSEFVGGNVTIPHKLAVHALCDTLDDTARSVGAVNTLTIADGSITGSNTDMAGFLANLDHAAPGWDVEPRCAIVLGAGGAARAILAGLATRGFAEIVVLNRTLARAEALAEAMAGPFRAAPLAHFESFAGTASLLVNTTAVGMHGTGFDVLPIATLPEHAIVTDIVYTPPETPLLAAARRRGLATVDGLGMLLHQAAPGFAAWFGATPQVTPELRRLVEKSLEEK